MKTVLFPLSSYLKSELYIEIVLFVVTLLCCYYTPSYVSYVLNVCGSIVAKICAALRPQARELTPPRTPNTVTSTPSAPAYPGLSVEHHIASSPPSSATFFHERQNAESMPAPATAEPYIVNQIKERGNHLSWYQSMLYPKAILELWQRHSDSDNAQLGADLETFSVLCNAAIRLDRNKYCMELLHQMDRMGVKRTKKFFESTIRQLASKRHFKNALEVLQMMEGEMPSEIEPTSFACAINFCAQIGDAHNGIRYFSMLEKLETPSLRAYMVVLRLLSKVSDWRLTLGIVQSIKAKGIAVDSFVLNQALSTLVNNEQLDNVREILCDKAFANIRNLISYNLYLKALTRVPTLENYNVGIQFLNDMYKTNLVPNHITYNTMMDFAVKLRKSEECWNISGRMLLSGVKPDEYTISILVRSLSLHADKQKIETVTDLILGLEKFNPQKINLDHIISAMLEHANRLEDCGIARQRLLEYSRKKNLRVRGRLYQLTEPQRFQ